MDEQNKNLPEVEATAPRQEVPEKSSWQQTKESWYDKIPLTVKQLDIIIGCGFAALALTAIAIVLDVIGVF